jgi:protein O-mannosyl-transferase
MQKRPTEALGQTKSARFLRTSFAAQWLILALAVLIFSPLVGHGFVNFDDPAYVVANVHNRAGLSLKNILWTVLAPVNGMWHALTQLSFFIEYQFFGDTAFGYHLTNVWIHVLNTFFLLKLLLQLECELPSSIICACVFLLHPLNLESVAWISERKGLLFALFTLLLLLRWVAFVCQGERSDYWCAFGWFVCAGLSKSTAMALPVCLTVFTELLHSWKGGCVKTGFPMFRGKVSTIGRYFHCCRSTILLPFWVVAIGLAVAALITERRIGAIDSAPSVLFRLVGVSHTFSFLLGKFLLPINLSILYPRPLFWEPWYGALVVICTVVIIYIGSRRGLHQPWSRFGLFWYVALLLPTSAITHGPHSVANRYGYVSLLGWIIGLDVLLTFYWVRSSAFGRRIFLISSACVLGFNSSLSILERERWRDPSRLWNRSIQITADNPVAYANLGGFLLSKAHLKEGAAYTRRAIALMPFSSIGRANLGKVFEEQGKTNKAERLYLDGLTSGDDRGTLHYCLGALYRRTGNPKRAAKYYLKCL